MGKVMDLKISLVVGFMKSSLYKMSFGVGLSGWEMP